MKDAVVESEKPLLQSVMSSSRTYMPIVVVVVLLILGVGTGYLLSQGKGTAISSPKTSFVQDISGGIKKGQVYGSTDEKSFKDVTEGKLEKGGVGGEGSHKLIRPGGEDQTAALTSSVLDLDQFAGHKVKVWGQTYNSDKVGWFMDVGRVEIME